MTSRNVSLILDDVLVRMSLVIPIDLLIADLDLGDNLFFYESLNGQEGPNPLTQLLCNFLFLGKPQNQLSLHFLFFHCDLLSCRFLE